MPDNDIYFKLNKARLDLENIILFLDRKEPNIKSALEVAREQLQKLGGIYR